MNNGCFTMYRQLGSCSWQKQVWTYPVFEENMFGDHICEMKRATDSGQQGIKT